MVTRRAGPLMAHGDYPGFFKFGVRLGTLQNPSPCASSQQEELCLTVFAPWGAHGLANPIGLRLPGCEQSPAEYQVLS